MSQKAQQLRQMMRATQNVKSADKSRVTHKFAKYNSADQLVCVLCNSIVKSDALWAAHLQSPKHKENISSLKDGIPSAPQTAAATAGIGSDKRPRSDALQHDAAPPAKKPKMDTQIPTGIIPAQHTSTRPPTAAVTPQAVTSSAGGSSGGDALPMGFFDDPTRDWRHKDVEKAKEVQLGKEWEQFQTEVAHDEAIIQEVVREEENIEREDKDAELVHEQEQLVSRVQRLKELREAARLKPKKAVVAEDSGDSDIDPDSFDWRAKKVR
eukprot:Opistho-2@72205